MKYSGYQQMPRWAFKTKCTLAGHTKQTRITGAHSTFLRALIKSMQHGKKYK
jgi:hypothetical protein